MDLKDFGTDVNSSPRHTNQNHYNDGLYNTGVSSESPLHPIQWKVVAQGVYEPCGTTHHALPPGTYGFTMNQYGEPQMVARDLQVDDLIDFAGSLPSQILQEIDNFWTIGDQFKKYGYLHRRGYLLYGPQGSGKSSVVHQVVHRILQANHIAVFCEHPGLFSRAMEMFRKVEPHRPVICLFEDIDAIIDIHGDSELLQWLDGSHQIDKVINIATTNYPERLDRRVVSRPRRFDRIIKIESPDAAIRKLYFSKKLADLKPEELENWVELTDGLSFAALAELVISVACLGNSLQDTIKLLRELDDKSPSSREFEKTGAMGFGGVSS